MRKRPNKEEKAMEEFINSSADKYTESSHDDLHKYVQGNKWPLYSESSLCSIAEGSNLKKPLLVNMKECEWNTIERHVTDLNIAKSEWIRHALFKAIKEEQLKCLENYKKV